MKVLAFDTSTSQGGVAVVDGHTVLSRQLWSRVKTHSELLTPTIETVLTQAGLKPVDLDAIAVGHGPGSFTGIRISVNAARTFGYALKQPVYSFDTCEILAAGVNRFDLPLLTLINAQKNQLFFCTFQHDGQAWRRQSDLSLVSFEELSRLIRKPHLVLGDGFLEFEPDLSCILSGLIVRDSSQSDFPLPEALGRMASLSVPSLAPLDWIHLQALYIRASGAEEKLREERTK